jgi:hypothetical protein
MALQTVTPETIRLIEELSLRTGMSDEHVVESALREQFDRLRDEDAEAQRREDIYALVDELRALVKDSPGLLRDPGEVLYGEDGLPK